MDTINFVHIADLVSEWGNLSLLISLTVVTHRRFSNLFTKHRNCKAFDTVADIRLGGVIALLLLYIGSLLCLFAVGGHMLEHDLLGKPLSATFELALHLGLGTLVIGVIGILEYVTMLQKNCDVCFSDEAQ